MDKAGVCKTPIQRFESARRLQIIKARVGGLFFSDKTTCPTDKTCIIIDEHQIHLKSRGGGMADATDLKSVEG